MPLPMITGVARLVADPELRVTSGGKAVCSVRLAFNSRKKNDHGEWEDGETFWVRGTAWDALAENVVESLTKGMEVTVSGELRTESWEKDGQKHQMPSLNIRAIGPNLAYAVARVQKANSGEQGQQQARPQQTQQRRPQTPQTPQNDPWAVNETPF